jgi:hypothetical protein
MVSVGGILFLEKLFDLGLSFFVKWKTFFFGSKEYFQKLKLINSKARLNFLNQCFCV